MKYRSKVHKVLGIYCELLNVMTKINFCINVPGILKLIIELTLFILFPVLLLCFMLILGSY
jgi:hypothetical protein